MMKIDWLFRFFVIISGGAYFCLLFPYYSRQFEVPDYFLYHDMGHAELPAADGFSSLFLKISSNLLSHYDAAHFGVLALLTLAVVIFNLAFIANCQNTYKRVIFLAFSFSISSWYYFDGKVFYEYPFIAINFALLFWVLAPLLTPDSDPNIQAPRIKTLILRINLGCLLAGLCISWKAHAIFPVFGLFGLIIIQNYQVLTLRSNIYLLTSAIFFIVGFLSGNYHFLDNPHGTLVGIKGYPGTVEILHYLFNNDRVVWDHINFQSFDRAVINIPSAFILLFICPFIIKRGLAILGLNIFIVTSFLLVIHLRSRGYPWHGFPFSLYFIVLAFLILANRPRLSSLRWGYTPLIAACLLQIYSLCIEYLPAQSKSFHATTQSIGIIQNNSDTISDAVTNIISANGPKYMINLYPKRTDKEKQIPIDKTIQPIWNNLVENQCRACEDGYEIFVVPYPLLSLSSFPLKLNNKMELICFSNFLIGIKNFQHKALN